jgi:hypothetical protein
MCVVIVQPALVHRLQIVGLVLIVMAYFLYKNKAHARKFLVSFASHEGPSCIFLLL